VKKEDLQEWCSLQDITKLTPADVAIADNASFKLKSAEDLQKDFEAFKAQMAGKQPQSAAQDVVQRTSWRNGADSVAADSSNNSSAADS
jgi:hypothetical protein